MSMYNSEGTIAAAIRSILSQTYQNWELCLIDDGSSDFSLEQMRRFSDPRIRIISDGRNKGLAARLNEAVRLSRGKYCARMDSDDIMYPERLAEQVAWLDRHPEVDLLATRVMVFDDAGRALGCHSHALKHKEICARPWDAFPLAHPTWMMRREWIVKFGYRVNSFMSEDQDLLLRAHRDSTFACLPKILLGYRQSSISIKKEVRSRVSFGIDISSYYMKRHQFSLALLGFITQVAKISYITTVVLFGYGNLPRRRAMAVSSEEVHRWIRVWGTAQESQSLGLEQILK